MAEEAEAVLLVVRDPVPVVVGPGLGVDADSAVDAVVGPAADLAADLAVVDPVVALPVSRGFSCRQSWK